MQPPIERPQPTDTTTTHRVTPKQQQKAAARRPAACRAALPALGCRLASPLGLTSPPPPPPPQWRGLATGGKGGPEEAESHDDFKPQRKAPPADLDGAVQMIEEQVCVYVCVCMWGDSYLCCMACPGGGLHAM